jgi:hypothetical protein
MLREVYHRAYGLSNLQCHGAYHCSTLEILLEFDTDTGEGAMTRGKSLSHAMLLVGVLILLGSAVADIVGLGVTPLVFGYRQLGGLIVVALLIAVGATLYWRAGRGG